MLCYRCGSHVPDGTEACGSCGQKFALGLKPGPIAGFGTGTRRHRIAVETSPYKVGEVLVDRFEIRDNVGAGPVGWVYKAVDHDLDVDVAVKVISPRLLQTADERRSVASVLANARKLNHPNIVRVYEEGTDRDRLFFTMQHLEGLTLRRIWDLRRQKAQMFTLREVEPIVEQVARALDHGHAVTAHGDLKPDNILVLPDLIKLTDFGIANALPRAPFMAAQKTGGVHRYLAPEFLHGERIDPRGDVFSLGVIVGEMLAGSPFEGASFDLAARNPTVTPQVERVFRKAVAARPEERFASAGELARALAEASGAAPVAISAGPSPARVVKPPAHAGEAAVEAREITQELTDDAIVESIATPVHGTRPVQAARAGTPAAGTRPVAPAPLASARPPAATPAPGSRPVVLTPAIGTRPVPPAAAPPKPSAPTPAAGTRPVPAHAPPPGRPTEPAARLADLPTPPPATRPEPRPHEKTPEPRPPPAESVPNLRIPEPRIPPPSAPEARAEARFAEARTPVRGSEPVEVRPRDGRPRIESKAAREAAKTAPRPSEKPVEKPAEKAPPERPAEKPAEKRDGKRPTEPKLAPLPEEARRGGRPVEPAARPVGAEPAWSAQAPVAPRPPAPAQAIPTGPVPAAAPGGDKLLMVAVVVVVGAILSVGVYLFGTSGERRGERSRIVAIDRPAPPPVEAPAPVEEVAAAPEAKTAEAPLAAQPRVAEAAPAPAPVPAPVADAKPRPEPKVERAAPPPPSPEPSASEDARRKQADAIQRLNEEARRAEEKAAAERAAQRAAAEKAAADRAAAEKIAAERAAAEKLAAEKAASEKHAAERAAAEKAAAEKAAAEKAAAERAAAEKAAAEKAAAERKAETTKAAEEATPVALPAAGRSCPAGMRFIPAGAFTMGSGNDDDMKNFSDNDAESANTGAYCVDLYEFPNKAKVKPTAGFSWKQASDTCRAQKKRLCSEAEWERACKGPSNARFPYGRAFDAEACNTEDTSETPREVGASGAFPRCVSAFGVFDLSGNLAEWTDTGWDEDSADRTAKGGAANRPGWDARCAARTRRSPGKKEPTLGFRCCADAR